MQIAHLHNTDSLFTMGKRGGTRHENYNET